MRHLEGKQISEEIASRMRVIIIEDLPMLGTLYSIVLRKLGHEVVLSMSNGDELAHLEGEIQFGKLDLAIVDYRLKGKMNGLEITRQLKENNPTIRIIIASSDDSIEQQTKAAGFGFLLKPFSIDALIQHLE